MPCFAQWEGHRRKPCCPRALWAWGSERPTFTRWFHVMDSLTDFQPSSQRGKCDKDWLTNKYVIFLGLNKMSPFYSLRGWLWLFLPYTGYFSDWIHLPAEFLLTSPLGDRLLLLHVLARCLKPSWPVFSLPIAYLLQLPLKSWQQQESQDRKKENCWRT